MRAVIVCTTGIVLSFFTDTVAHGQAIDEVTEKVESLVWQELADATDGKTYVIVLFKEPPAHMTDLVERSSDIAETRRRILSKLAAGEMTTAYEYKNVPAMTGRANRGTIEKLARDPDVVRIGADVRGEGHLAQSVPFINADDAYNFGVRGAGVTVAVLDTGIDTDHPDLSDNVAPGAWHFLDQGANQGPGAEDDNGHGSNVCGIITSKGVVASRGVAPDADILAVKVLDAGNSGWLSDWTAGVDYVVSVRDSYANLCAINMSLGSFQLHSNCPCNNDNGFNQAMHAAILAARNAGIVTFASSGNAGSCTSMSAPACLSSAVAVVAVYDQNLGREPNAGTYQSNFGSSFGACFDAAAVPDMIACFSNRSGCNELAAPGRLITSPFPGGGLGTYTGTSQASPHCAAVAALMCEKDMRDCDATLTPAVIVQTMKDTGQPTTDPCTTSPNPIRVDALASLNAVLLRGDFNGDHAVTLADVAPFAEVLAGIDVNPTNITRANVNCDGATDGHDVQAMADLLVP